MAYLDVLESGQLNATRIGTRALRPLARPETISFSRLEWTVVALAKHDGPASLTEPGPLASTLRRIFGQPRTLRLADDRLEALRRTAVLARRWGHRLPAAEVSAFHAAGFTPSQLDTLLGSVELDLASRSNGRLA